jgi:internalin A
MKPDIFKKIYDDNPKKHKFLHLGNGRLSYFPTEVCACINLVSLDAFNNSFTEVPDCISNLKKLRTISLNNNILTKLPDTIISIQGLSSISLKSNRFNTFPEQILHLPNITKLDISNNTIPSLPTAIANLKELEHLDISGNNIKELPDEICTLKKLKTLDISSLGLTKLPECLGSLENLQELNISNNKISFIPDSFSKLKNLQALNLINNNISQFPPHFDNLVRLSHLNIKGNPIDSIPIEIEKQGSQGIINYFISLTDGIELHEAKLLIVGHGGVGKTKLMYSLIQKEPKTIKTTEGIDIRHWPITTDNIRDFRVNIWDFGGQEIYHSTHQFFLTKRSLYLFVWEARKDEYLINFDYWLNIIKLLSNSSPVIIVLNKIDERLKSIDEHALLEKFHNIIGFQKVSAKDGTNISDLSKVISSEIEKLPLIGEKLPKLWIEIRKELESICDNFITYKEYTAICNKHGLDNTKARFLSQYYHDIGVFLHFTDNPILKNIIFLKPEWATNAVYKIIDTKKIIEKYGEFHFDELNKILNDYPPENLVHIVELMKKFELCFEFGSGNYIIPELLKPERPLFNWNYDNNLNFEYHYDFMPAGVITRLIVRLHDLIQSKVYWKNGVIIQRLKAEALIISDPYTRRIKISIFGDEQALLLEVITRELDYIHKTLNHPDVIEKVPCNCDICKKSDHPYLIDYHFLRKARGKLKEIPCQESMEQINIDKLLGLYKITYHPDQSQHRFNAENLLYDIIEKCSRLLERKRTKRTEDLITDDFTDYLRDKGYHVTDQTRSGIAVKHSGELDILIRNNNGVPVSIIEAFRLSSCGLENKVIIEHINRLLYQYDSNGLRFNFILIYGESPNYNLLWENYIKYMENLSKNEKYNKKIPIVGFSIEKNLSMRTDIKIGIARHLREGEEILIYHIMTNLYI